MLRTLVLFAALAVAPFSHATTIQEELAGRSEWQRSLALVQVGMEVEIQREGSAPEGTWIYMERTPQGRMKVVRRKTPTTPTDLTFLVQGKTSLALAGDQVGQPPAPWMMGDYLFGESLEPEMLLAWTMGLPGPSYSVDSPPVDVVVKNGELSEIYQDGWQVSYAGWEEAGPQFIPTQITARKGGLTVSARRHALDVFSKPPAEYKEFSIY